MAKSSAKIKTIKNLKLDEALKSVLKEHALVGKTESLKIGVLYKKQAFEFHFGSNKYTYYDLASLSKVIFSVTACYHFESEVSSILNKKVSDILPWFSSKPSITVLDLLAHQSGAPAVYPVFKDLKFPTLNGLGPLNLIVRDIPFDQNGSVYSDVGFFLLGAVLEEIFQKPLYFIFEHLREFYPQLYHKHNGKAGLHFNPVGLPSQYPKAKYAPTEVCSLREKTIQAEVHDENCWRMGGVGPHAGLFGGLRDVMQWLKEFNLLLSKNTKIEKAFLKKQKGDWRLGLMVPSKPKSSCGQYFSDQSYGHLGFTGTSFWVDPKVDLSVVILSHRTFPSRDNKSFNILRPLIHDTVYTSLLRKDEV